MFSGVELPCEDELPARQEDSGVRLHASFASCLNTTMSCHFIDMGMPVARYVLEPSRRARAYLQQIAIVARSMQCHVEGVDIQLSMGQLAALLLHKSLAPDIMSTQSIVGLFCFEETTETTSLCMKPALYVPRDIDVMCKEFVDALGILAIVRERYKVDELNAPVMNFIRRLYPKGCAVCIFNVSALLIKTTLCYDTLCVQNPSEDEPRLSLGGDRMCEVICGYAFNSKNICCKHRIIHLFQTAMLLEPRFVSTCISYGEAISECLTLKMFKTKAVLDEPHTNAQPCLHDAICAYMNYNSKLVVPWACVTVYIATYMFETMGADYIGDYIRPPGKAQTGHCLLMEKETERVLYFS